MTLLKFVFAMFLSFLPGLIGVMFTPIESGANVWYNSLNNSMLAPDGWVFSVVWMILYFLLGLSLFFVMQKHNNTKTSAYILFVVHMVLNALWSFVFFGLHLPEIALLILTALIITAIFMALAFLKISKSAFWLTIPYIIWLAFAFYLNGVIVYLN